MSFLNPTRAAFISAQPMDKIVRVFTGSYNAATETIGRTYTSAGFPYTAYFYRIPHGLPRPVACEMIASTDGGATFVDGGIERIAFSDSTYVYVFDSAGSRGAGTVQYKVWCSWIDNYDTSNPLITTQSYSSVPIQFDSRANYQKIAKQDVLSFSPGTFGSTETKTVVHDLSYAPNVKVFFEAFSGEVWPLNAGQSLFLVDDAQEECALSIGTTDINVTMYRRSNSARRAWYRIYYDAN